MKRSNRLLAFFSVGEIRQLSAKHKKIFAVIALVMAGYQIWSIFSSTLDPINQMAVHLSFILVMTFYLYTFSQKITDHKPLFWLDLILVMLAASCGFYYMLHAERIATRIVGVDPLSNWDIVFGLLFVLLSLEAARRTIGISIVFIGLAFIGYALFGHLLDGIWYHRQMPFTEVLDHLAFSFNGLWGSPIAVTASFVFIFVLFGSFLKKSGASDFFFDLSVSLAGRTKGGAAKITIFASAFSGMISGSPTANVVTTGMVTIPMAKKIGYLPRFAAAVEAIASTGGSFIPPIMGSSAFLMAAVTGISYRSIAIAAILPAILFFVSLYSVIHFEAIRLDLPQANEKDIPKLGDVLKQGWFYFIPIIVLVVLLIQGYSPSRTGFYGMMTVVLVSWLNKDSRMGIRQIIKALIDGAKSAIPISTACAIAGLVIAGIMTTGLGGKLNSIILGMTSGNLLLSLFLIMVMCIILGMGMPVAAAYVLTAMLAAPTLINMGISVMAAHLFIVYFSIISAITPPVAVAAFAAAGIAGENPTRVSFEALRLGLASFIIPFLFVYQPALLLDGSLWEIILSVVVGIILSIGLGYVIVFGIPKLWQVLGILKKTV